MDANFVKEEEVTKIEEMDSTEEMKPEVQVTSIYGTKLWIKIVYQKTKGRFTKIMEAISVLGFDITDISVTTSKGAILVTSCVEISISLHYTSRTIRFYGKRHCVENCIRLRAYAVAVSSPAPAPSENGVHWMSSGDPEIPLIRKHHSSVAGGDAILGGLAIVSVAAIFFYIRITRQSKESHALVEIILFFQLPFSI
ncbi:unnamed protein product [Fraxinus pennsylvanica]|uniref:Plant bHLH transcription factor ACT-like domain-containing protein n=1 Tax=Fraxinus pennsylvanica TaxID=56036 RepID=A0AAD1YSM7_9LAMI|nr:unnamed protein product [Fraxinus pennsylvanica]